MLLRSLVIATVALTAPTLAAAQTAKSGSFETASAFKGIEEARHVRRRPRRPAIAVVQCAL